LAHEVKNPLGAIKGAAQLLSDPRDRAGAIEQEFVGIILEEVERLGRLTGGDDIGGELVHGVGLPLRYKQRRRSDSHLVGASGRRED
jgi:hypothetical protein